MKSEIIYGKVCRKKNEKIKILKELISKIKFLKPEEYTILPDKEEYLKKIITDKFQSLDLESGVNILIDDENRIYLNRIYPLIDFGYKNSKKEINTFQFPEIFGINRLKIKGAELIIDNYHKFKKYKEKENTKNIVEIYWKEISINVAMSKEINKYINSNNKNKNKNESLGNSEVYNPIQITYESIKIKGNRKVFDVVKHFMEEIYMSKIKLKNELENILEHEKCIINDYVKKISDYLNFFKSGTGENFIYFYGNLNDNSEKLNNHDLQKNYNYILINLKKACSHYSEYAHTEFLMEYYYRHIKRMENVKNISFISYYDMCILCEKRMANIANKNIKIRVVSFKEYKGSRSIYRTLTEVNNNLTIIYE
ncbi:hypothetical protein PIROE2DRAFT_8187 [Piromyces sp. E2]|nr:hypothetical protein PIROE2DRAFT_8187 [Piromyces sp. E2]|eukprot:OUM64882.1 hypothetical protein PIROE2DRAFT_8187 [Piromyces sp. E2]